MAFVTDVPPVPIPRLSDGVVRLRPLRADDVEAIVAYSRDPDLRRWSRVPHPYTRQHAADWVSRSAAEWQTGERHQFAIEAGGVLVGDVSLRRPGPGVAEIGFGLAPEHRGRGRVTRALRLALPWAFEALDLVAVHWRAAVGNWASRRVAWAVGFRIDRPVPGLVSDSSGAAVDGWISGLRRGDPLTPVHPWFEPVRIEGSSVRLREHRETDLTRIAEACRDKLTQYWLSNLSAGYPDPAAGEHLQQVRADHAGGRAVCWAVADPGDDRLLAEIGVFVRDPRAGLAEVGYWAHPDARGRGVVTEAVRLAARHALLPAEDGGLGFRHLLLRAAAGNAASQRVAVKAGFTRSGVDRQADRLRDGTIMDDVRFDLLAQELPVRR